MSMSEETRKINPDSFTMMSSSAGTLFEARSLGYLEKKKKVAQADETPEEAEKMIPWGTDNMFPNDLVESARYDTVITPGLRFKTQMQFGGGVAHGLIEIDPKTNKEVFRPQRIPEVVKFLRDSGDSIFTALYDLNFFSNAFLMLHFTADGKKATRFSIHNSRAKNCRHKKKNTVGDFTQVVVKPELSNLNATETSSQTYSVPPTYDACQWLKDKKPGVVIIPLREIDHGNSYYSVPDWNTARESKWMEVSKDIANFKKFLIENQITLKYHIEIDPKYWPSLFGKDDWKSWDQERRKSKVKEHFDFMSDWLTKKENQGKSFMTGFAESAHLSDKQISLVKFTPLENKFSKDGVYIEDSKEASDHKISALGSHKDIIGSSPGNTIGSGSGSGNRVAFNQRVSMSKSIQDLVLAPLYLVAEFNGWGDDLEFRMRESLITTLDSGGEMTETKAEA